MKHQLFRITTIPLSLDKLLGGQLKFMSDHYQVTGISSQGEQLQKVATRENIKVAAIEMTRQITPFKDLKAVFHLYRYFKKHQPFIVHSHTPKAGTLGMLAAKLARVPHRLHTVAGLPLMETTGKKRKLLNFVERFTYSQATRVYPNSFGLQKIILDQQFCKAEKLKVLANGSSNGINTQIFSRDEISVEFQHQLKKDLLISETDFVFIFVGRLVSDKGINELIVAFKKISAAFPQAKLLLVGPEEQELDPLQPVTQEEIKNNAAIISVGFQQDVRPYFAISDALAFPSYREGFPNVVLQAGAMDLPSIVTDINGCNEIIIDEFNGLIVPPKDSNALFLKMKLLLTQPEMYDTLKKSTRQNIVKNYAQEIVWNALLNEYKRLERNTLNFSN